MDRWQHVNACVATLKWMRGKLEWAKTINKMGVWQHGFVARLQMNLKLAFREIVAK